MKKYFTKYLSVEGKIKQGDKAQYKTGEIISYDVELNTDNLKKVELFLCTKDIKEGDKIRLGSNGNTHSIADKHNYFKNLGAFKVIGKISKDATWVKEGDEFDKSEIKILFSCRKGEECDLFYGEQICNALHNIASDIFIKGSCKHFH